MMTEGFVTLPRRQPPSSPVSALVNKGNNKRLSVPKNPQEKMLFGSLDFLSPSTAYLLLRPSLD